MYYFIYPSKDSYIYELNDNSEKNFGGDNNLVLKKEFDGDKDLAIRSAKLHDALFAMEKNAIEMGGNELDIQSAQIIADQIMEMAKMMGLEKEHDYVQNHVNIIRDSINKKK